MNNTFIIVCFSLFCPGMPYLDYRLGRGSRKMPDYASISGHFARCFAYFARVSGIIVICSEITDCGKSDQNPASCYYLLVVKLVVKWKELLLRILLLILNFLNHLSKNIHRKYTIFIKMLF